VSSRQEDGAEFRRLVRHPACCRQPRPGRRELKDWRTKAFFTGFFGYRHQRPEGFLFRVGVIPLLWTNTKVP
jgi:hypothetical protein